MALDAERVILGVILLDNDKLAEVQAKLNVEDFFSLRHRTVYRAMLMLEGKGKAIDPLTLADELEREDELEQVGGKAQIAGLFDGVPKFSNISEYVDIVRDKAAKRALIAYGSAVMNAALDDGDDASEQIAEARRRLDKISDPAEADRATVVGEVASDWLNRYLDFYDSDRALMGIGTGFRDIDRHMAGISKGDLTLVGGRPGMGKTGLLTCMAERAVMARKPNGDLLNPNLVVAAFSMELSADQFMMRWLAGRANISIKNLMSKRVGREELRRLDQERQNITALPITIDDTTLLTPARFRANVQRIQKNHPGSDVLVILDYLQMMKPEAKSKSLREDMTAIAHDMKRILKDDLDCYCLAAVSLSRANEARSDKRPNMADIRESGDIESDAATIMFIHREDYYRVGYQPTKNEEAEIIFAKGRFCGPGSVKLAMDAPCVRFGDYMEGGF